MGLPNIVRIMKEYNRGTDAGFEGTFPCPNPDSESFFEGWREGIIARRTGEIDEIFTSMHKDWEKVNSPDLGASKWHAGQENLRTKVICALVSSYLDDLLK